MLFLQHFTPTGEEIATLFENVVSGNRSGFLLRIHDKDRWLEAVAPHMDLSAISMDLWKKLGQYSLGISASQTFFPKLAMTAEQAIALTTIFGYKMQTALITKIKSAALHLRPEQITQIDRLDKHWPFVLGMMENDVPVPREVQMAAAKAHPPVLLRTSQRCRARSTEGPSLIHG